MIRYRTFCNFDPPHYCAVWNDCIAGHRAPSVRSTLLDFFTLSKPYFDPAGVIFAEADGQPVGLAHAGFAPLPDGTGLDHGTGVLCVLGVVPDRRRQGVGSELLRRAEDYMRQRGATHFHAGPLAPLNPFTFGLYGGCDSPGFLDSDSLARPFLEHHGYQIGKTCGIFQRPLERALPLVDPRFPSIRQRYDVMLTPHRHAGWWRECVLGPVEAVEYRLQEQKNGRAVARAVVWDMGTFAPLWNQAPVGLIELFVLPELRRQGLARYLLAQALRHLRDQPFHLFEAQSPLDDPAGVGLLRSLDFQEVEIGRGYEKTA